MNFTYLKVIIIILNYYITVEIELLLNDYSVYKQHKCFISFQINLISFVSYKINKYYIDSNNYNALRSFLNLFEVINFLFLYPFLFIAFRDFSAVFYFALLSLILLLVFYGFTIVQRKLSLYDLPEKVFHSLLPFFNCCFNFYKHVTWFK